MKDEGVIDADVILPNNTAGIAAAEILFVRYKQNLYGTDIENAAEIWCSLNDKEATLKLMSEIQNEVQRLYTDDNFRQKVFRAMHVHEAKSWK